LTLGILAIIGGFFVLRVIASVTQVSIFSLNLATALGLSLAIDYSLFVVSRYREELRGGLAPKSAIVRAVETAGRTVVFSPVAVGLAAVALLAVLGSPFLHIKFGLPDDRVLPASASSRQVQQQIRTNFNSQEAGALEVVAGNAGNPSGLQPQIDSYAAALSR